MNTLKGKPNFIGHKSVVYRDRWQMPPSQTKRKHLSRNNENIVIIFLKGLSTMTLEILTSYIEVKKPVW